MYLLREVPKSVRHLCEAVTRYDHINVPLDCVTEHTGSQLNCLRREVLENAWFACKQQYGAQEYDDHNHLYKRKAFKILKKIIWQLTFFSLFKKSSTAANLQAFGTEM